jgi:hypothetical protein
MALSIFFCDLDREYPASSAESQALAGGLSSQIAKHFVKHLKSGGAGLRRLAYTGGTK